MQPNLEQEIIPGIPKIELAFAWIISADRFTGTGGDLEAINPMYRLESGAVITSKEFEKLKALTPHLSWCIIIDDGVISDDV